VSNRSKHNAEGLPGIVLAWVTSVITVRQQSQKSPLYAACRANISAVVTSPNGVIKLLRPVGCTYNHNALTAAIDTIKLHQELCLEAPACIVLPR